ncbi:MAG: hypothetical protein SGILL_005416 [Bacillariaceae sp.]
MMESLSQSFQQLLHGDASPVSISCLALAILIPYYIFVYAKQERISAVPHVPSILPFVGSGLSYFGAPSKASVYWRKKYGDVYTMMVFGKTYLKVYRPADVESLLRLPEKKGSLAEAYIDLAGKALPQPDTSRKMKDKARENPKLAALLAPLQSGTPLIAHSVRPHNLKSWVPDIEEVLQQQLDALSDSGRFELFAWCQDVISCVTVRMMLGSKVANDPELLRTFVDLFFEADPERGFGTPLGALTTIGEVAIRGERQIYVKVRELLFQFVDEEIEKCVQRSKSGSAKTDFEEEDSSALASMVQQWYHRKLNGSDEDIYYARTRIANDLFNFTFAAFSNSFGMSAWVLYHYLLDTKGLQSVLRKELLETPENKLTNTYPQLEVAILEMARLYTPGDLHRKLKADWPLPSNPKIVVPKGTVVLASALTTMRDKTRFDKPNEIDWNRDYKKAGAMFMPFGAGAHPCVGRKFALLEIALLTAETIRQLDMKLMDPGEVPPTKNNKEWAKFEGEILEGIENQPPLDLTQPGFIWRPTIPIMIEYQKKKI